MKRKASGPEVGTLQEARSEAAGMGDIRKNQVEELAEKN